MSRFTPRDFGDHVRAHWYKMIFQFALKHMKLELLEESVEDNVKVFRKACKEHGETDALEALKNAEKEGVLANYFTPQPLEEGEQYAFKQNGKLVIGTIVKCDCCGGWSSVNTAGILSSSQPIRPIQKLENIPEMVGWSEEREQAECDTCSMNNGVPQKPKPKKKVTKKKAG